MKTIQLNKNQFAIVDDMDFDGLSKFKWHVKVGRKTIYAQRKAKMPNGKYKTILMHRQILGLDDPKILCDHQNRNGLDNQRSNLRSCTTAENSRNQGLRKTNTSGYKGVTFDKRDKKFKAEIRVNGKLKNLGLYKCPAEAAKAYDAAAANLHGEYAFLNFQL
jgi:hypothetical protein